MEHLPTMQALDLMRVGNLDGANAAAEREIQRLGEHGSSAEVWRHRFIRAQVLDARGQTGEALKYLRSPTPPNADDIESEAALRMYRGSYSGYLGQYETSHKLLHEAEVMARDAGLPGLQGEVYLCRAFLYFRKKDYASSDRMFRDALAIAEQVGSWYFRGHALWGIGKNLMIEQHYEEAMPWLNESLEIFENAAARLSVAMVWSELAVCHLGLGDDEKAMELLREAERVNYEAGAIHNYQVVLANIGNVYLQRRDHFTAISYYQRALALAREIKDPVSVKKWTRNINLAYARIRLAVDESRPHIA